MSLFKFECQSSKKARLVTIADLDCYLHQSGCFGLREPRECSCHTFIGFRIGLFIPVWLSTGNLFRSLGKAFIILMVSKPDCVPTFKLFKLRTFWGRGEKDS